MELRLHEAESHRLPYSQFLELVFQDELDVRISRQVARRRKAAGFRDNRNLEDFDFSFNPSVPRGQVYQLATCQFVRHKRDVLLISPPGVVHFEVTADISFELLREVYHPIGKLISFVSKKNFYQLPRGYCSGKKK